EQSFATEAKWKEARSDNTFENAVCSEFILGGQQIRNVFLVTHASHMPRAVFAFDLTKLQVTPAPTGFQRDSFKSTTGLERWLPSAGALAVSRTALHEWLGKLYYRFNYGSDDLVRTAAVSC
ncbi:MAG: ElyC/SanA/YdcF family protein, partial [Gammaproteobacteria bacterium]